MNLARGLTLSPHAQFLGWLVKPVANNDTGVVQIKVGKLATDYTVREIACDWGAETCERKRGRE